MSETNSIIDMRQNLRRAAGFDADMTYPMLFQHLGYRKLLAEIILQGGEIEKMKEFEELYERVNAQIKLIIGV